MISLTQNFICPSENCDILHLPEILNAIKIMFGEGVYNDLVKHKGVEMEISAIICDAPTKIEVRYRYDKPTIEQNLINENSFSFPWNITAQIISTQAISGTIMLTIE